MNYNTRVRPHAPKPRIQRDYSSEEIARAVERFQKNGGLIERLPEQKNPERRMVAGKYGGFELVSFGEMGE